MMIRKLFPYFIQGVALGLVLGLTAIVFIWLKPFTGHDVVEIKQAVHQPFTDSQATPAPNSYAAAVQIAAPAVVNIYTSKTIQRRIHPFFDDPAFRRFFGEILPPERQRQTSLGSGVIVSSTGYVVTNHHVIDGADEILVALNDGRSSTARLVGSDPETDLAVLKIPLENLHSIVFGHSDQLQVGDVVLAIGNPYGVGQTVTQGIVSATGRNQLGLSTFENFIQTDAAINPGNSGGALINPLGELLGINTAIFSRSGGSQGIGFAIPANLTQTVMKQLIEVGHVVRSWLGIESQTITQALADSFDLENARGIIIAGIVHGSPAEQAGLQIGDVITHIDDQEILAASDVLDLITRTTPNTRITIRLIRNGQQQQLTATLGTRPPPAS